MPRAKTAPQDSRLVRNAAQPQRDSRSTADADRVEKSPGTLSAEERRRLLRDSEIDETLPTPPEIPGWRTCWLSTTHRTDTIYNRVRKGWQPVMQAEIPGFDDAYVRKDGSKYDGIVACEEMLLYKIPEQIREDLMVIYHHDKPNEEEAGIRQKLQQAVEQDSKGTSIGISQEGGFTELGSVKTPIFNC